MKKKVTPLSSRVNIFNLTASKSLQSEKIKKKTIAILKQLDLQGCCVDIHFVTDAKIKKINSKYLDHDCATDVIAFGQQEGEGCQPQLLGRPFLGDIVISTTTARRESKALGHSFEYEFFFYLVHGLLHLKGYSDRTKRERQEMHQIQSDILEKLKIQK